MDRVPPALDAVVIGSGVGGLTAAALLSKAGKRVLVLEQHDQAGGCTHTFQNKGFEFDVGKMFRHKHTHSAHTPLLPFILASNVKAIEKRCEQSRHFDGLTRLIIQLFRSNVRQRSI